jgi:hypothetical protein
MASFMQVTFIATLFVSAAATCVQNTDCTVNAWCNDAIYKTWCPTQGAAGSCPSPMCLEGGGASMTTIAASTTSTKPTSTKPTSTAKTTAKSASMTITTTTKVLSTTSIKTTTTGQVSSSTFLSTLTTTQQPKGSWVPCVLDTATPGADIADNADSFPDPFVWYTNPSYPGVTLPGPTRATKCAWKVGTNFVWDLFSNQCILNGAGYPMTETVYCSNGLYSVNVNPTSFAALYKSWYTLAMTKAQQIYQPASGAIAYVVNLTISGQPVQAAMSIGHGVLAGLCGDCFLIRQGNQYVAQLQTDVRAWSLEVSAGANSWLASDNVGGTCYVPDVQRIDCSLVLGSR